MVEMQLVYEGGFHARSVHGPSGACVETDAPTDNRGKGEAFSPTDLLASSLASCMLTTMAIRVDAMDVSIDGARARVEKHMELTPRRRVGRVVVEIAMPHGIPESAKAILEEAARFCPVASSLHENVEIALEFEWC